ncbi:MAG: PadR family transcriptional regulator [Gemmatimonadetes bacterium]|nr:PadR family transcriptional regulator [Gemmatimonadota bacterium]MBT8479072.1 PadR family transcriptional regulator [Gemmatimonadota bacterium]NNK47850.1 PadR family transcriptional regulator [Gemmatimonadota bacterium]
MNAKFDKGSNPWSSMFGPGASGFGKPNFRWRIFDRGDLKYMILELLRERPMHGYEVMRALEKSSGGAYTASPGSVYPTLQSLEDDGYVSGDERDGRKVYTITDEGREFLDSNQDRVEQILRRIADFAKHFSGAPMTDVTRSFMRLAQASFEQSVRRVGDEDSMDRLREILEKAARDIENVGGGGNPPGSTGSGAGEE